MYPASPTPFLQHTFFASPSIPSDLCLLVKRTLHFSSVLPHVRISIQIHTSSPYRNIFVPIPCTATLDLERCTYITGSHTSGCMCTQCLRTFDPRKPIDVFDYNPVLSIRSMSIYRKKKGPENESMSTHHGEEAYMASSPTKIRWSTLPSHYLGVSHARNCHVQG